jgi:hypothetical protein
MAFFLVKAADEAFGGDFAGALKTLTSGASPEVQTVEDDVATAFQDFLNVFGPAEAKTLLTTATTTVQSGIKAGLAVAETGTVANAVAGAQAAGTALAADAAGS